MFYITPTPISLYIWIAIWIIGLIFILGVVAVSYLLLRRNPKVSIVLRVIAVLIGLSVIGMSISSKYYNYTHSASYKQANRNLQIEYKNNQKRTLELMNINGKVYFKFDGYFSYKSSDNNGSSNIEIIDTKTGKKLSVETGQNDTFVVTDDGINGSKSYSN